MIKTSIITIGDELLIGQVIDSNSAWMAQQLNKAGIPVVRRVAVGDNREQIWKCLDEESKHSDIILITGGLGPTADDITKPLLCEYFGGNLIVDEPSKQNVIHLFENVFKRPITDRNLKQAEVPDNCTVLFNKRGTAPGMLFEKEKRVYVSMPGVPHEMQGMMTDDVVPFLTGKFTLPFIQHKTLLTFGIGESMIADLIQDFETHLPSFIRLAYLPNYGMVRLRLTGTGADYAILDDTLTRLFVELQQLVQAYLVTSEDEPMEKVVAKILKQQQKSMCTAESCTGGYIAHLITAMPGSSAFYDGSVVSYSYQAKEDLLQVSKKSLLTKGAVSEEVVLEMARGVLKNINSTYAIAVSGIMGPGGGMPGKPVGTVWVAVGNKESQVAKKFHFRFDRLRNIQLTAVNALNMLRVFMLDDANNTSPA